MVKNDVREKIKLTYKIFVRIRIVGWFVSLCMLVLVLKMFYLQVIKGDYYKRLAESNCVSFIKARAPRGEIYDRNYKKLVGNEPSYTVSIIPFHFAANENKSGAVLEIAGILNVRPEYIYEKLEQTMDYILEPVVIKRDVNEKELSLLAEKSIDISGISVSQEPKRSYEHGALGSHVLGYTGEITGKQLKTARYKKYRAGDVIGQTGIENYYDEILKGEDGAVYILTDSRGRQKEVVGDIAPKKGKNVVLTIDYRLQKYAELVMDNLGHKGVIIAAEPATGEILCMVSKPDFDLSKFSGKIDIKYWKKLARDTDNPFTNRAVQGLYSPGSIFKIPVGMGILEEKIVNTGDTFLCEGIYWIKTWPYKCWKRTGHGWVNFHRAIEESCDIYFYRVGLKMKVELLHKYAVMFGLGEKTGIDIPGEKAGVVPSREWKRRVMRTHWFPGNTIMMSIGQGFITSTPLQVMNIMSAMANGGHVMQPHFLKAVTVGDERKIYKRAENKKLFDIKAGKKNIEIMRKALRSVVSGRRGTGYKCRIPGISVAGKTGTVENPHGETHAMFAGFAPYDKPEIVVFVLVEHGGGGGDTAAPVAKEVIEYYLKVMR